MHFYKQIIILVLIILGLCLLGKVLMKGNKNVDMGCTIILFIAIVLLAVNQLLQLPRKTTSETTVLTLREKLSSSPNPDLQAVIKALESFLNKYKMVLGFGVYAKDAKYIQNVSTMAFISYIFGSPSFYGAQSRLFTFNAVGVDAHGVSCTTGCGTQLEITSVTPLNAPKGETISIYFSKPENVNNVQKGGNIIQIHTKATGTVTKIGYNFGGIEVEVTSDSQFSASDSIIYFGPTCNITYSGLCQTCIGDGGDNNKMLLCIPGFQDSLNNDKWIPTNGMNPKFSTEAGSICSSFQLGKTNIDLDSCKACTTDSTYLGLPQCTSPQDLLSLDDFGMDPAGSLQKLKKSCAGQKIDITNQCSEIMLYPDNDQDNPLVLQPMFTLDVDNTKIPQDANFPVVQYKKMTLDPRFGKFCGTVNQPGPNCIQTEKITLISNGLFKGSIIYYLINTTDNINQLNTLLSQQNSIVLPPVTLIPSGGLQDKPNACYKTGDCSKFGDKAALVPINNVKFSTTGCEKGHDNGYIMGPNGLPEQVCCPDDEMVTFDPFFACRPLPNGWSCKTNQMCSSVNCEGNVCQESTKCKMYYGAILIEVYCPIQMKFGDSYFQINTIPAEEIVSGDYFDLSINQVTTSFPTQKPPNTYPVTLKGTVGMDMGSIISKTQISTIITITSISSVAEGNTLAIAGTDKAYIKSVAFPLVFRISFPISVSDNFSCSFTLSAIVSIEQQSGTLSSFDIDNPVTPAIKMAGEIIIEAWGRQDALDGNFRFAPLAEKGTMPYTNDWHPLTSDPLASFVNFYSLFDDSYGLTNFISTFFPPFHTLIFNALKDNITGQIKTEFQTLSASFAIIFKKFLEKFNFHN